MNPEDEEMTEEVFGAIEKADSVVIFGHKNPDGDCVGSVMGLKLALLSLFPGKKVYAVGTHPAYLPSFIPQSDDVPLSVIEHSLAVLVDLSDIDRVEDKRITSALRIVSVDHHVSLSPLPFPVLRDVNAPSATYILTKVLLQRYHRIPKEAADPLYMGLVTDSGRFQFDSEPETFLVASKLIEAGAQYKQIYKELYKQTSKDLRYRSFIYDSFRFDGLVTYCVVHKADYERFGFDQNEASGKVNLLSLLDDHPMWAFFIEQEDGVIRVELRSDGEYDVQKVAVQFGGGGHVPASGCRLTSFDQIPDVLRVMNASVKIA